MADPDLAWQSAPEFRRYSQFELVGEGVSARVYKAHDAETGSTVAIKAIHPHLATDAISLERFRREVRITREIGHPQVVAIYDLIDLGGRLFMVMEYLAGGDLKQHIRLHSPLPATVVVDFLRQILSVLDVCHRHDVVHRDLKPHNILLDRGGDRLKLVDFGIARMTSLADLTQTGTSLGSPEYMAPELYAASTYDPRTDLYAVGVIAYEMVTSELPFQGDSVAALFRQHLEEPPPEIRDRRPDTPAWLRSFILKLLDKNPYARYQTATEALADLAAERVLSDSLPDVALRTCTQCTEATTAELAFCTLCGHPRIDAAAPGRFDVHCDRKEDRAKLTRLVEEILPASGLNAHSGTLLVSGVDQATAEQLRDAGRRHGIYLDVRERSRFAGFAHVATRAILTAAVGWLGAATLIVTEGGPPSLPTVAVAVGVTCLLLYGWESRRALVARTASRHGLVDALTICFGLVPFAPVAFAGADWARYGPTWFAVAGAIVVGSVAGCLHRRYRREPWGFWAWCRAATVVAGAWLIWIQPEPSLRALLVLVFPAIVAFGCRAFNVQRLPAGVVAVASVLASAWLVHWFGYVSRSGSIDVDLIVLAAGPLLTGWWAHRRYLRASSNPSRREAAVDRTRFDVHLAPDTDPANVRRLVQELSPGAEFDLRSTTLLMSGVDQATTEWLRSTADRHGLELEVRQNSWLTEPRFGVRAILIGLAGWAGWLLAITEGQWPSDTWEARRFIGLLALTGAVACALQFRASARPIIGRRQGGSGRLDLAVIGIAVATLAVATWATGAVVSALRFERLQYLYFELWSMFVIGLAMVSGTALGGWCRRHLSEPLRALLARYRRAVEARPWQAGILAAVSILTSLALTRWPGIPIVSFGSAPERVLGVVVLGLGPLLAGWWTHRRAMRSTPTNQPAFAVGDDRAWLEQIASRLRMMPSKNMRRFSSQLIRHEHLLGRSASALKPGLRAKLRTLTTQALEVAGLVSDVEGALERADLGELSRRQRLFGARAQANVDATERVKLEAEATALLDRLRQYDDLQRQHESMTNRLLAIQSTFNGLLAKGLVLDLELGDGEVNELTHNIELLETELGVATEVRASLRGLAP